MTLQDQVKKEMLARANGGRRRGKISPEKELEMVQDFLSGMSFRELGAKYGISGPSVHERIRRFAANSGK